MMEEQYLKINKEQSKKLNKKGFRTFTKTSVVNGQEKIVGYVVNLSDILSFLEREVELMEKIKKKHNKMKKIDKELFELHSLTHQKLKQLAILDINKTIEEIVEKKLKEQEKKSAI